MQMPEDADLSKISANFKDGVLAVTVQRTQPAQPEVCLHDTTVATCSALEVTHLRPALTSLIGCVQHHVACTHTGSARWSDDWQFVFSREHFTPLWSERDEAVATDGRSHNCVVRHR